MERRGAAAVDANGQPVNTYYKPLFTDRAAISAAGGKYNTDLLTDDDKKVLLAMGTSAAPAGTGKMPTGSAQEIAKQLLPFIADGKVRCVAGKASRPGHSANCQRSINLHR